MKYTLSVERPGVGEQIQAEDDSAKLAAALDWASGSLRLSADATRFLRSADGSVNARNVRTHGGKWFAIALLASPICHEQA